MYSLSCLIICLSIIVIIQYLYDYDAKIHLKTPRSVRNSYQYY
nr:MAG TPA: hypothetical protein [Inoviridae sp.]